MKTEAVYIKIEQDNLVMNKKIFMQDIAKVYSQDKELEKEIGQIIVYTCNGDKNEKYIFSILKIVELIHKEHPGVHVVNLGETDFIVEYKVSAMPKKTMEYVKTILASLILFFGAALTIMTFNTDVSIGDVFGITYKLVFGKHDTSSKILEITYSVGLAFGILVFYNHFSSWKRHNDPTPIQIEMRNYEEEMNKAVIKDASREGKTIDV